MRQVCGLDVHKDSVFVCILNEGGIVFQEKYGVNPYFIKQLPGKKSDVKDAECVRKLGKLDAALQRCNIRTSNYVSTTDGKSYKEVVRLISVTLRNWRKSSTAG